MLTCVSPFVGDNSEDLDYGEEDPVSVTITSHEWPAEADKVNNYYNANYQLPV